MKPFVCLCTPSNESRMLLTECASEVRTKNQRWPHIRCIQQQSINVLAMFRGMQDFKCGIPVQHDMKSTHLTNHSRTAARVEFSFTTNETMHLSERSQNNQIPVENHLFPIAKMVRHRASVNNVMIITFVIPGVLVRTSRQ